MSAGALTGIGGVGGSFTGAALIAFCNSSIRLVELRILAGERAGVVLDDDVGIDAVAFDHDWPSVLARELGTKILPPSISGTQLLMPTTPPQVRLPISGPSFACLNM